MLGFAAVFTRVPDGWAGRDVDMDGLETLDEVVEVMRDATGGEELALLFVEEDEEWFAILRVEGAEDPRVFISDVRAPMASNLAALLYSAAEGAPESEEEDEAEQTRAVAGEPGGDVDLLEDLGIPGEELLTLTVGEGLLPADVLAAISEQLDFVSELDKLR